jgi:hypothetical protein
MCSEVLIDAAVQEGRRGGDNSMTKSDQQSPGTREKQGKLQIFFSYLNNGFVLLLVGSLITYLLVPSIQRKYEERQHRREIMTECLKEFSLAANLIYQEFFVISAINIKTQLTDEEYIKVTSDVKAVRAKRFDAFARVKALATIFYRSGNDVDIEEYLEDYYNETYRIGGQIDDWVRTIYCASGKCINYGREKESGPAGYKQYIKLQRDLEATREAQEKVSQHIMKQLIAE